MVCGHCQKCREPYVKSFQTMGMRLMFPRIERGCFFFHGGSKNKVKQRECHRDRSLKTCGCSALALELMHGPLLKQIYLIYLVHILYLGPFGWV